MIKKRVRVAGIIPARYGSTRLPAKVLADINGKPMIQHVWEGAHKSRVLDELWVACDDERILKKVEEFGGKACMTSPAHASGTERIAEAARSLKADIILNIQGDEPLIEASVVDTLGQVLVDHPECVMATVIKPFLDLKDLDNPNIVKVVVDHEEFALYFSRCAIPYNRAQLAAGQAGYYKHLGLYAYRRNFLSRFKDLPESPLEKIEQLEQLRVLQAGYKIKTVETDVETISVDVAEDLIRVKEVFKKR